MDTQQEQLLITKNTELEKELALKNRELEIEASLENVRAIALVMKVPADMMEVCRIIATELGKLGVKEIRNIQTAIFYESKGTYMNYEYYARHNKTITTETSYTNHKIHQAFAEQMLKGKGEFYSTHISRTEIPGWIAYQKTTNVFIDSYLEKASSLNYHWFSLGAVALGISTYEPLKDEDINLFRRFLKVFELSYTRYLDIEQAIAQAREAKIETALEKVRSHSLAMHTSEELKEVIITVLEKLQELGIIMQQRTALLIEFESDSSDFTQWVATPKYKEAVGFKTPFINHPILNDVIGARKNNLPFFQKKYGSEVRNKLFRHFYNVSAGLIPEEEFEAILKAKDYSFAFAPVNNSAIAIASFAGELLNENEEEILTRFAKVFDQTYTRFLDLQKAEAQAREARIEAALERIRSRSLAMHHSDELREIIGMVYIMLSELKVKNDTTAIQVFDFDTKSSVLWPRNTLQNVAPKVVFPYDEVMAKEDTPHRALWDAMATGNSIINKVYTKQQKDRWFEYIFAHNDYTVIEEHSRQFLLQLETLTVCFFPEKYSGLYAESWDGTKYSEEDIDVLKRAARVFEQAYVRFLDLQKAEAQAREAQIETALERVRARTMAMQKSDELAPTVKVLLDQFRLLQDEKDLDKMNRGFITTVNEQKHYFELWITEIDGTEISKSFVIDFNEGTTGKFMYEAWQAEQPCLIRDLQGETLHKWLEYLANTGFKVAPGIYGSGRRVNTFLYYSQGFIGITSSSPLSGNNIQLLGRFAKVFEQTYTRFLDLQKAETQALEAIKRASVDRVRAEIASMRTTNDLERITPLIWNELTTLGVPFIRCGVFIMDEGQQTVQSHLSTPDGKATAGFRLRYYATEQSTQIVTNWQQKKIFKYHMDEAAFADYTKNLLQQGAITSGEKYLTENRPIDLHLHFLPFLQGMLYVGNTAPLNDDALQLAQNLADAFSTAYARYEDFNKLEAAKKQVDSTLNELQATQKQLIQSEKMASLGELTAGIAHEIQNPLNFVNNFSEVNAELIEELNAERLKPKAERNEELENEILNNIKENEQKINHHGKRAGDIVKGMLQHSRTSTGKKEPTDINALCDEYLRLAYHGLRAKEKDFNADFKTEFDESIGKINIVPQDIGRVILNLINNAFYAVSERQKAESLTPAAESKVYQPAVLLSTKKISGKVLISVKDNGNGIPQKIVDKIFQPFFTTKPTGQGTGLGLSLSYDIVKAHGGEIKVETKEGKGTEFTIMLSA